MSNRRRSERFDIALPVWLKDARGGERTTTMDVSAHGIAVLATHERPLRQYVELELNLDQPEATITVTAVVARHAELRQRDTGEPVFGLGLDFFLFDAQAKAVWQQFIRGLHTRVPLATPQGQRPAPPPPPPPQEEDDTATFIIKPRDLGRLWAFFRGEMTRGVVRIESPVAKPLGHPAELLVVHPTSQAEWSLDGHVVHSNPNGRGGRPVLEIGLDSLSPETKAAFRTFVATGRGQVEEEVSFATGEEEINIAPPTMSVPNREDPEPERIESVVIDLDNFDPFEDSLGSGVMAAPPRFNSAVPKDTPSGLMAQAPDLDGDEDDPTQHTLSPIPPGFVAEPAVPPRPAAQPTPSEVPDDHDDDDARPTSVFASFFAEAQQAEPSLINDEEDSDRVGFDSPEITDEAEVDLSLASRALSHVGPVMPVQQDEPVAEEEPIPLVRRIDPARRQTPPSATPPALPTAPEPRRAVPPSARIRSSARSGAAALQTDRSRPTKQPGDTPSVKVRPLPPPVPEVDSEVPVIEGQRASVVEAPIELATGRIPVQNPQVPPGNFFDFGDPSQRIITPEPKDPPAKPAPKDVPRAASRIAVTPVQRTAPKAKNAAPKRHNLRRAVHEQEAASHRNFSTESHDPALARDIALARARVVRSPHSVTACYRLSSLLLKDGESDDFQEAIQALEKVMALEPNHPGAHHKLAELYARRGDYGRAAEHLSRARRLGYQIDADLEHIISEANKE